MDSVDDKGNDAGQDGEGNGNRGDTRSKDNKGANIPSGVISKRYLKCGPGTRTWSLSFELRGFLPGKGLPKRRI